MRRGGSWQSVAATVILGVIAAAVSPVVFGQWLDYPTPGVPRTPDGKPNLTAPTPRTADGKPDLTGMWGWENRANCGSRCNDGQIGRESMNLASNLKGGPPYRVGTAELVKQCTGDQVQDPNVHCMPRGAPRIWTDDYYKRIIQTPERLTILTERNIQYRQIFTDGRPLPVDPHPTWIGYSNGKWDGPPPGGPNHRVSRRPVAGRQWKPPNERGQDDRKNPAPEFRNASD